ncbi:cytochrome b/b6 domain-containing protein [Rickettsia hoogstraalii]|uniref:cytochrome b n=1 Tax=Rickettsia hoogstraalii TaxID=467174 RepID=UPI00224E8FD3|nr:cytochrome b/b6 domain-containing protein [Rickettsia hoogstraalii]
MLLTNTENSYGLIAKFFHWIMSIIVIVMLVVGFLMDNYIEPPLKWQLYGIHEATGIVVLSLVIIGFYGSSIMLMFYYQLIYRIGRKKLLCYLLP